MIIVGGVVCAATHPGGKPAVVAVGAVVHTGATTGPGSFMQVISMPGAYPVGFGGSTCAASGRVSFVPEAASAALAPGMVGVLSPA